MYFFLYIFQISCIQLKNTFDGAEDKKNNKDNRQSTNRVKGVTHVEDLEAALSSTQGSHTGEDLRRAGLPMPTFPGQGLPRGMGTNFASRQQPPYQHPLHSGAFYGSPSVSSVFGFSSLFLPLPVSCFSLPSKNTHATSFRTRTDTDILQSLYQKSRWVSGFQC